MFANRTSIYGLILTTLLAAWPGYAAAAADWIIDTKIKFVEGTYIPGAIFFWVKTKTPVSAGCITNGNGTALAYRARSMANANDKKENVKAVYDMLLAATGSQRTVRIGGLNISRTPNDHCNVETIYLSSP